MRHAETRAAERRAFVCKLAAVGLAFALGRARAEAAPPAVTVYSSPACGCCGNWLAHLRAGGFRVHSNLVEDVTPMKRKLGVPESLHSCHTATVGGYVIEGHVPAGDIKRLLREQTAIRGLAVPGMVTGSPGMEQGAPRPYATIAFGPLGTSVYQRH